MMSEAQRIGRRKRGNFIKDVPTIFSTIKKRTNREVSWLKDFC